jgi:long-chain acyl-CoA synthetase
MQPPAPSPELRRITRVALGDLVVRSAERFGERSALIDGERRVSHRELDELSSRFAHHLLRSLTPGTPVATLTANRVEMVAGLYGISKAGMVWVPVNVQLSAPTIEYILEHAEVGYALVDQAMIRRGEIREIFERLGIATVVVTGDGSDDGEASSFAAAIAPEPAYPPEVEVSGDDLALIMYTSGTTGQPKGAMHTHLSVYSAVMANAATHSMTERDVLSALLPLFHCAQHSMTAAVLSAGGAAALARGFTPAGALELIERAPVTIFGGLPMMYAAMLAHERAKTTDFRSVRLAIYAMAAMPRPLIGRIAETMGAEVWLATGQTEAYPVTLVFRALEHPGLDANYWGVPTALCETQIMDERGNLLGPGQAGEIVHRGPNVMAGYLKDPEATAAAQRFGWHHTGDLGVFDASGQLLFLDRAKDMIKTGGENVASIRVESALLSHPEVANAAVIGVPHPHWGEAVLALVLLRTPDVAQDEGKAEELIGHAQGQLANFEVPKRVVIVESLPATATGKIRKAELREAYRHLFDAAHDAASEKAGSRLRKTS